MAGIGVHGTLNVDPVAYAAKTTLNETLTDSDTTITLTSTTGFASSGRARIDSEVIAYTGTSGNDLTGCTRGVEGSTAVAHSSGASCWASPAELLGMSGWSSSNWLEQPHNSDVNDIGTGDLYGLFWCKWGGSTTTNQYVIAWDDDGVGATNVVRMIPRLTSGGAFFRIGSASISGVTDVDPEQDVWHCYVFQRVNGVGYIYRDGVASATTASMTDTIANTAHSLHVGTYFGGSTDVFDGSIAMPRFGAGSLSPEEIKRIYESEKPMFYDNAACTLNGSSNSVTALAHDSVTNELHVGTSGGRSVFQGLIRTDENTNNISVIAAEDSIVLED